jgi:sec-independent protein translocase protein TatA
VPAFIGSWEILLLVAVVLLLFGTSRLPGVARSLGRNVREVKDAATVDEAAEAVKSVRALNAKRPSLKTLLLEEEKPQPSSEAPAKTPPPPEKPEA